MRLRLPVLLGFVVVLIFGLTMSARAHEVRPAIFSLNLKEDRSFSLTFSGNAEALLAEIGPDHEDTDESPNALRYNALRGETPDVFAPKVRAFAADYANEIGLTFSGEQAQLDLSAVNVPPVGNLSQARVTEIAFSGSLPAGATDLMWRYPQKFGSSILRVTRPGQEMQSQWFQAGSGGEPWPLGVAPKRTAFETFVEYAKIGFLHILPKGADHILFVLGLFFLSLKWKPLLAQVTAFTLAHSVTLALGLYGIVQISPAIVEPLIALSIVYVAVENILTRRLHIWRPVVVFLFGLLHGLGFAGILSEIGLPRSDYVLGLVAFNVGVEIGQLAVIAIAFLCVGWFAGRSWYRWRIAIPASVAIGLMGAYWFLERTLLA